MVRVTYIGTAAGPQGAADVWQPGETRSLTPVAALSLALRWPGCFEVTKTVQHGRPPDLQVR